MSCKYTREVTVTAHRIASIDEISSGVRLTATCGKELHFGPQFMSIYSPEVGDYIVEGDPLVKFAIHSQTEFEQLFESDDEDAFPELPEVELEVDDEGELSYSEVDDIDGDGSDDDPIEETLREFDPEQEGYFAEEDDSDLDDVLEGLHESPPTKDPAPVEGDEPSMEDDHVA